MSDVAELATDHLDADVLGSARILDGVASRLTCLQSGRVPRRKTSGRLVEPQWMAAVSEAVLVFAGIAVAFTDKAVAAAGDAGTEPCAYVGADFGLCASTCVGGIALGLDADSEHGAAAFLVSYEGVVSGFAPQALRTIVLVIHVTASRYTNKPIAGEAAVALVFTCAGLVGRDASVRDTAIQEAAIGGRAVDITGAREPLAQGVHFLTTAGNTAQQADECESTHRLTLMPRADLQQA